jgi:hypothetical protein
VSTRSPSGLSLALGTVAALALAGTISRRGSRAVEGQVVGQTRARANVAAMWTLAAEKLYGSWVDVPVVATREALQNSRDAIRLAVKAKQIGAKEGAFRVTWDPDGRVLGWEDNGIGMSRQTVEDKFLSLGDTTKFATAERHEVQAGGFGLAKAILLGASKTFSWTLETRDHTFTANGFDQPIQIRTASTWRQGTLLVVRDVSEKYERFSSKRVIERIAAFLATNETPFPIFFNGTEVPSAFSGRGKVVEEGANWGPDTTGKVRVYKRTSLGGRVYVRLLGLTQFSRDLAGGKADFDVVVDLETTLAPTQDGYPFTASRMQLSGPAETTLDRIIQQFGVDMLSRTKGEGPDLVGEGQVDPQASRLNEAQMASLLQVAAEDPEIRALLAKLPQTSEAVRRAFAQVQRQIPPSRQQQAVSTAGEAPEAFQALVSSAPESSPPPFPATPSAPRRSDGRTNPFAGAGKLKINAAQWDKKRLAPYLKKPEALLPLLALWRIALQMVYAETGRTARFTVGFLFDDDLRAEFDSKQDRLFSLNPVPVVKLAQTVPNTPEVIASYLHNKACHEVTHALGLPEHNESYVARRQSLADQTAQLLAPLTMITAKLLGMDAPQRASAGPRASRAPRKKPEAKVKMNRGWSSDSAFIFSRAEGEKKSPLYIFSTEFARLFSEAGFPTQMDEEHAPEEDYQIRVYTDVVDAYGDSAQIILTFWRDDFSGPGFYGTGWREVLTPAQFDALQNNTATLIPLASQAVPFLQRALEKAGYRKPGSGGSNRSRHARTR